MTSLSEPKREARERARQLRAAAHAAGQGRAAMEVRDRFLRHVPVESGTVIAGYVPIRDELDPNPLLDALASAGATCCLPVTLGRGQPLRFRLWRPGEALVPGLFGVPAPAEEAAEVAPTLVLVPMLGFDRKGHRLGYGAGFYDRTLDRLRRHGRVLAIGLAYAGQELPLIPADPHDQPLDWIVTEREAFKPSAIS
ncbi:5-formyltetrahydrofolate cyclo-ligase [Inquilinus sp. CAU 1745]|uniref:5-formyltetrahydrofolate cyclo-ligase n=1 Tax=Inquilinus sp. CAU 1745 TaxID=3140369 RepID=UPI00325BDB55